MQITCPQCKVEMKRADREYEPGMDTFICRSCGTKKHFPRKSHEDQEKLEKPPTLDKERAAFEGILPQIDSESRPKVKKLEETIDEKTQAFEHKEVARIDLKRITAKGSSMEGKDSSSKIKNLVREIKTLTSELNDQKAKVKVRDVEEENFKKILRGYLEKNQKILAALKNEFAEKIGELEKVQQELERKLR